MNALHAKLIADYCKRPELEAMLLDERLAYFAMHEVEKVLSHKQGGDYDSNLWLIICRDETRPANWHATAQQRAEAYLKTIGKWEDEE